MSLDCTLEVGARKLQRNQTIHAGWRGAFNGCSPFAIARCLAAGHDSRDRTVRDRRLFLPPIADLKSASTLALDNDGEREGGAGIQTASRYGATVGK